MNRKTGKISGYQEAGVNIKRGNALVQRLKKNVTRTCREGVMGDLGGFGALFDIGILDYRHPILVSGTDGVGTKVKLAVESGRHDAIGIDLVAMCVNDVIVQGAEPLFFLDYFACSSLDVEVAERVINGIIKGCSMAGTALVGGEIAEMPGMYRNGDYDLAGFCVGVVEKDKLITGEKVSENDVLIALASSGCHANGYSLIRKILSVTCQDLSETLDGKPLIDHFIEPTQIYVRTVLGLIKKIPIRAIAHITGGGLIENIPRVIPDSLSVEIDSSSWTLPAIFKWLQETWDIDMEEMYRTFNCGAGLVLCVSPDDADSALENLNAQGIGCWKIGRVKKRQDKAVRFL